MKNLVFIIAFLQIGKCEILTFISEEAYLNELLFMGYEMQIEDFEGNDWEHVRSINQETNSASYVESSGITWTGNGNISTNTNWGVDNTWGLFTPYDPNNPSEDYLQGSSETILYGIGCWLKSNAPGADMGIYLDDILCSHEDAQLSGHTFYGVINTNGFNIFFIEDTEHESVFGADNFIFAINSTNLSGDINLDGVINVMDIVSLVSTILDSNSEYNPIVDLNDDGSIDILDVVQLVDIILNN